MRNFEIVLLWMLKFNCARQQNKCIDYQKKASWKRGRGLFRPKGSASNCRSLFCSWWHKRVESWERSGGTKVLSESKKKLFLPRSPFVLPLSTSWIFFSRILLRPEMTFQVFKKVFFKSDFHSVLRSQKKYHHVWIFVPKNQRIYIILGAIIQIETFCLFLPIVHDSKGIKFLSKFYNYHFTISLWLEEKRNPIVGKFYLSGSVFL